MKDTCTYVKMWGIIEDLQQKYNGLVCGAKEDGSTLAQYAGSEKLAQLATDLEFALGEAEKMANYPDRREAREAIIAMLDPTMNALADASLFEVDPAANFKDYSSSRECPIPKIIHHN